MKKIYSKPFAELMLIEEDSLLAGVSRPVVDGTDGQSTSGIGTGGSGDGDGANDAKRNSLFWLSDDDDE